MPWQSIRRGGYGQAQLPGPDLPRMWEACAWVQCHWQHVQGSNRYESAWSHNLFCTVFLKECRTHLPFFMSGREDPDPAWALSWCGRPSCQTFAWMSTANEFCWTMCQVRELDCFELVYHSSVFMSKRRLFDKFGELCISSMLQDAFGDLILVPNSKRTERLPDRRAEGLAAAAFVC